MSNPLELTKAGLIKAISNVSASTALENAVGEIVDRLEVNLEADSIEASILSSGFKGFEGTITVEVSDDENRESAINVLSQSLDLERSR